ncbi:MAG TPA: TetR/AcrR family transcriptional regulator C-terminal domain-containing protein [Gaiellales bacterium]|nr:TetR/AcrR family transcriptional regulator C-terminal domain-containing protein [Gaiellales bacterium]
MGKPATRPTARLDAGAIIDAAVRVIDAEGLDGLTMRRLGREMGADPTAMYRHFRNKDDLQLAICDRLLGDMLASLEPRDGWRDTLRDMAWKAWETYHRHPHLAHLLSRSPEVLDHHERLSEIALAALTEAGLSDADAALSHHLLVGYTSGFASASAQNTEGDVLAAWRRSYALLPAAEFPNLVRLAPVLFPDAEEQFRFGIELFLDGVERLAAESTRRTPRA